MPFTVAHAAIAPPLARLTKGRLPASALALGAMSPDFEYVIFLETRRTIGHTPLGLLVFCLPASLVLFLLWHRVVKRPVGRLLPQRWGHLGVALDRPRPAVLAAAAAALIGAASHLLLDAFTHAGGAGVARFPQLRAVAPLLDVPVYKALQYGLGVAGLLFLAGCIGAWARRQPRCAVALPPARSRVIAVAFMAASSLAVAAANVVRTRARGALGLRSMVIASVLGAMAGGAVAVLGYALGPGRAMRPGRTAIS